MGSPSQYEVWACINLLQVTLLHPYALLQCATSPVRSPESERWPWWTSLQTVEALLPAILRLKLTSPLSLECSYDIHFAWKFWCDLWPVVVWHQKLELVEVERGQCWLYRFSLIQSHLKASQFSRRPCWKHPIQLFSVIAIEVQILSTWSKLTMYVFLTTITVTLDG